MKVKSKGTSHNSMKRMKEELEGLYRKFNHKEFVHPDPLEFLYSYSDSLDREIVGLIASSLAYGRVAQILKSVGTVLEKMRPFPREFLMNTSEKKLRSAFSGFKHRFTTGEEVSSMLIMTRSLLEQHGSLNRYFLKGFNREDDTVAPALSAFVQGFEADRPNSKNSLLPDPERGSACKRLNLFLRWMVRKDDVDPGGWEGIQASKLVVPLDTHMHRICSGLEMTCRKQADMRTAMEITDFFRELSPDDPVRYDFAITRLGIRKVAESEQFLYDSSGKSRIF